MPDTSVMVTPRITIPRGEFTESFLRASGAGGQNVNKVETAVQLRFDARGSPSLPDVVRARLLGLADRRLTQDGVIVITAQRFRTQARNRADAMDRMAALLRAAAAPPPPQRRHTRPTAGSRKRRLDDKRHRAQDKALRHRPAD